MSPETKAKLSAAMKGNQNAKGCKRSEETRRKLSLARKGKPSNHRGWKHTEEARAKISASLTGTFRSPKVRENLRVAQRVIKLFYPEVHERKAALSRDRMRAQNQDPAYRARIAAGQRARREQAALTRFSDLEAA